MAECGTHAGYQAHKRAGHAACDKCRAAHSAYTRKPPAGIAHGTIGGYRKCVERPQGSCDLCREAARRDVARYRAGFSAGHDTYVPTPKWWHLANCAGIAGDPMHPSPSNDEGTAKAIAVCNRCDVRAECLAHAVEHDEIYGVWGGVGEKDRRVLIQKKRITSKGKRT